MDKQQSRSSSPKRKAKDCVSELTFQYRTSEETQRSGNSYMYTLIVYMITSYFHSFLLANLPRKTSSLKSNSEHRVSLREKSVMCGWSIYSFQVFQLCSFIFTT